MRVAVVDDWNGAVVSPAMWDVLAGAADDLISDARLLRVDGIDASLPRMGRAPAVEAVAGMAMLLGDKWPACADELTPEMRATMNYNAGVYDGHSYALIQQRRMELNEAMARIFDPVDGVDLVITATNPDVAFAADGPIPDTFGGVKAGMANNGLLSPPANLAIRRRPAGLVRLGLAYRCRPCAADRLGAFGETRTKPGAGELHTLERERREPHRTADADGRCAHRERANGIAHLVCCAQIQLDVRTRELALVVDDSDCAFVRGPANSLGHFHETEAKVGAGPGQRGQPQKSTPGTVSGRRIGEVVDVDWNAISLRPTRTMYDFLTLDRRRPHRDASRSIGPTS